MRSTTFLAACLLGLACGCGNPTIPCGTFSFSGSPSPSGTVENISTTFAFDPSKCNNSCNCNTINYIQIVRVTDVETGEFFVGSGEVSSRIVTG